MLMAFVLIGSCFADANAQKRRTKKSRRVTAPVTTSQQATTTGSTTDPQIISTADEAPYDSGTSTSTRRSSSRRGVAPPAEDATRDKVDKLTAQVSALTEKLTQMEQSQRTLVDLERLSRAETRAETLRAQLRDVQAKEAELQTHALQLEYELQPAVIERTLASSGSTRPEDLREQRRRALEADKSITQTQLNQIATNRARLETAIANAEAEADRLRTRIDTALAPPANDSVTTDVGVAPESTTGAGDIGDGRP
jgi:chromosome segregation ATPase